MIDRERIVDEFKRIKDLGFIKSRRSHNTGIGKTFEDYLGVDENNLKDPDYAGFEVKSQRQITDSYLTLFTKSPSFPKGANAVLKDTFGKPDDKIPDVKVLHTSIFGDKFNTYINRFGFKLNVNDNNERVELIAKSLSDSNIIEADVYWTFDDLKACIDNKLKALFVVLADSKAIDGTEYFHYTNAKVYIDFRFDKFISAIINGTIMFDIRIGAYRTPGKSNYGKTHDHGSGFRIRRENLPDLFKEVIDIE
ncbi:MAG: MvaI/BcnI family restriction endonuclease [candidate division Zixibacteria bacterium]|nr:MvaI/BcnI family restriction endonuclease [candidate division Zixibacteria bacterium]